ncbi:3-oxo-tetronate kinase [Pantoea cypripedii]|uniref:3-oxo-tetronate kinase n=1 Tax=Pantoea cypripedii TaxID=55209 RepID=A0A6B9GFB4_PANCY|nr:3-oxo-tetronate kinase [Pantoea cypripedii]QGY32349.1 hypothetical protein CUN67_25535 [Pantoea cypripedii]
MLIGVIADDFTGASDIAVTLSKGITGEGGLKTTLYLTTPQQAASPDVEAGVIALKSRSVPAAEAVALSLAACRWLLAQGCQQIVFKYCSTFDSTADGNIGPVADALAALLGEKAVPVCPSFPAMGRTVYQGHLFVHDRLLNESGMEHHPLTPMKDADIRRVLKQQSTRTPGFIAWQTVHKGAEALREALNQSAANGDTLTVIDALNDEDLITIAKVSADSRLLTGGSGIAMGLPHNFIARGLASGSQSDVPHIEGPEAILVGSCSSTTLRQISEHAKSHPVMMVSVDDVMTGKVNAAQLVDFIQTHQGKSPLVFTSGDKADVTRAQNTYGREQVSSTLDALFGTTAKSLVDSGIRRLVVGGGETSGAVVSALHLGELKIGNEIDTGVPALLSPGEKPLALALKSGNFGSADFFSKAVTTLQGK